MQVDLVQQLAAQLPLLTQLTVSSLYLDQPARGLPFHFHLPPHQLGVNLRNPEADLVALAGLQHLTSLHLNTAYLQHQLGQCYRCFHAISWSLRIFRLYYSLTALKLT